MQVNFENYELKIGNEIIERIGENCKTKYFKFVGIHLDEHINWKYQINHVHAKLASANYAISSSKHFLPRKIRLTLYNSLFRLGGFNFKQITTDYKHSKEMRPKCGWQGVQIPY